MKQALGLFLVLLSFASPFVIVGATRFYKWKVPAIYVFGDSTADVGNNNYLNTRAKANFPHYGIDSPWSRPTGRFSNGYIAIDFIATHMGFWTNPPPYLSLNDTNNHLIMNGLIIDGRLGVNFASAGSGILDSTGTGIITMTQQVQYFDALRSKMLARAPNADRAALRISESLFIISAGSADAFAFFAATKLPNTTAVSLFYYSVLTKFESHIKTLYGLGARKFALINVPLIGCAPSALVQSPTGGCIDGLNQLAKGLNDVFDALFSLLSVELSGFEYSIGNSYEFFSSAISNPRSFGLTEVKNACCGGGKFNAESYCSPNATCCTNRNQYVFWDSVHPTHVASELAAQLFYNGSAQFVGPITFEQLAESSRYRGRPGLWASLFTRGDSFGAYTVCAANFTVVLFVYLLYCYRFSRH